MVELFVKNHLSPHMVHERPNFTSDLCSLQDPEAVQVAKQLEREEGFARFATKVYPPILYGL